MSKSIYTGVSDIARASKKFYIGDTDAKARKVKKMYIGDSDKKARLCYQSVFTWKKYVSGMYGTTFGTWGSREANETITIWPIDSIVADGSMIIDTGETSNDLNDNPRPVYKIRYADDFSYSSTSGSFGLLNQQEHTFSVTTSMNNYGIESKFIGKYVRYNGSVYKIDGHNDVYALYLQTEYYAGSPIFHYRFSYVEDVTSEDENAYESGSISEYKSYSSSDIRTVYVKQ